MGLKNQWQSSQILKYSWKKKIKTCGKRHFFKFIDKFNFIRAAVSRILTYPLKFFSYIRMYYFNIDWRFFKPYLIDYSSPPAGWGLGWSEEWPPPTSASVRPTNGPLTPAPSKLVRVRVCISRLTFCSGTWHSGGTANPCWEKSLPRSGHSVPLLILPFKNSSLAILQSKGQVVFRLTDNDLSPSNFESGTRKKLGLGHPLRVFSCG